jgi:hypothetical protein
MRTLEFKWSVSRGRETAGYNICSLYVDGVKAANCNGGGYDMKGMALGTWIARAYAARLLALTPDKMPEQSHWERSEPTLRICESVECLINQGMKDKEPEEYRTMSETCPVCGGPTRMDYHAGKRVDDGRYFYGLTFHDPDYNPGKAIIGKDAVDRTMGKGSDGKTVEEAEAAGESLGLERYQAFYSASSRVPTKTHKVPLIDGGCGFSSVEKIMEAIDLHLEYVPTRGKKTHIYRLRNGKE